MTALRVHSSDFCHGLLNYYTARDDAPCHLILNGSYKCTHYTCASPAFNMLALLNYNSSVVPVRYQML